jgi:flagellar basal body rod protein FlgB
MIDFSEPLAGLDRADANLDQAARRLQQVTSPAPSPTPVDTINLSQEMLALLEAQRAFEVNLSALRAANDTMMKVLRLLG